MPKSASKIHGGNLLENAIALFNQGNTKQAEKAARTFLKTAPQNTQALKLLGFIAFQNREFQNALEYLHNISPQTNTDPEIENLLGCIYIELNQLPNAENHLHNALRMRPDYENPLNNLAILNASKGEEEIAQSFFRKSLSLNPQNLQTSINYAASLHRTAKYRESIEQYKHSISLDPASIPAYMGIARCYLESGQLETLKSFISSLADTNNLSIIKFNLATIMLEYDHNKFARDLFLEISDDFEIKEELYNNLASAYDRLEDIDNAIVYYEKALEINPDYVSALSNLGRVLTDINKLDAAENHLDHALRLENENVNANINYGRLLSIKDETEKSKQYFKKALLYDSRNATALYNLGNAYHKSGDFQTSNDYYQKCLANDPDYADAEYNLGINELALGKFSTAWGHYFKRLRTVANDEFLSPITPGLSLSNKRIVFSRSQGIGDEIFFLRFIKLVSPQCEIIYRGSNKIHSLLETLPEISEVLDESAKLPICDYHFAIDDIPLLLNMNKSEDIPPPLPLDVDPSDIDRVRSRFLKHEGINIAITWRAGTQVKEKSFRSNQKRLSKEITIDDILSVTNKISANIIILQRHPDSAEIRYLNTHSKNPVIDCSELNEDLVEMTALLTLINDYIGVSNTNMHLLAGIGKTAKVLVPHPPDWRWMTEGTESPWFMGFHIYRQSSGKNWDDCLIQLQKDVANEYGE